MSTRHPVLRWRAGLSTMVLAAALGCGDGGSAGGTAPRAWIVVQNGSESALLRSDDRGRSWHTVAEGIGRVSFVDRQRGWATGPPISMTDDGGLSWRPQSDPVSIEKTPSFRDVAFGTMGSGVVAGSARSDSFFSEAVVIETNDGGAHWNVVPPVSGSVSRDVPSRFTAACITSAWTALAVGGGGFNSITSHSLAILRPGAGAAWRDVFTSLEAVGASYLDGSLAGVACAGRDELWIVGRHRPFCEDVPETLMILHSADGGGRWEDQSERAPLTDMDAGLEGVAFVGTTHGWAVGFEGRLIETPRPLVIRTDDGGRRWQRVALPDQPLGVLDGVAFASASDGIVIGRAEEPGMPLAFVTEDGGRGWARIALPNGFEHVADVAYVR